MLWLLHSEKKRKKHWIGPDLCVKGKFSVVQPTLIACTLMHRKVSEGGLCNPG